MFTYTKNEINYVAQLEKVEDQQVFIYKIEVTNAIGELINTHQFVTFRSTVEEKTIEVIMNEWFEYAEQMIGV